MPSKRLLAKAGGETSTLATPPMGTDHPRAADRGWRAAVPSGVVALVLVVVYMLDALVMRRGRPLPGCSTAGLSALAHWDSGWYISIANSGYFEHAGVQQPTAFFPLFPLLARIGHAVVPALSVIAVGIGLNVIAIVAAMMLVDRSVREWATWQRVSCVLLLLALPGAYFYVTFYSEALFVFSLALLLWALRNEKLWLAAFAVALASVDRTIGIVLIVPVVVLALRQGGRRTALAALGASCGGVVALALYVLASGKLALFRQGRAGWRGAGGLSYPAYLLDHGVGRTSRLIADAALLRRVDATPGIGNSAVWGLGLYADAVVSVVLALLIRARNVAEYLLVPGAVLGVATLVAGPAISQERFMTAAIPIWIAALAAIRLRRGTWAVLAVLGVLGVVVNLELMGEFATCRWAG